MKKQIILLTSLILASATFAFSSTNEVQAKSFSGTRVTRSFRPSRSFRSRTYKTPSFKSNKSSKIRPKSKAKLSRKQPLTGKTYTKKLSPKQQTKQKNFSKKHFSTSEETKIFNSTHYYDSYQHQSLFSNPWMWLFFLNHHHYKQNEKVTIRESEDYQKGYRDGLNAALKQEKKNKKQKAPWLKNKKNAYSEDYQKGWEKGFDDYVKDSKK